MNDNIQRIYDVSKLEGLKIEYDKDENTFQGFIGVKHVYNLRCSLNMLDREPSYFFNVKVYKTVNIRFFYIATFHNHKA